MAKQNIELSLTLDQSKRFLIHSIEPIFHTLTYEISDAF